MHSVVSVEHLLLNVSAADTARTRTSPNASNIYRALSPNSADPSSIKLRVRAYIMSYPATRIKATVLVISENKMSRADRTPVIILWQLYSYHSCSLQTGGRTRWDRAHHTSAQIRLTSSRLKAVQTKTRPLIRLPRVTCLSQPSAWSAQWRTMRQNPCHEMFFCADLAVPPRESDSDKTLFYWTSFLFCSLLFYPDYPLLCSTAFDSNRAIQLWENNSITFYRILLKLFHSSQLCSCKIQFYSIYFRTTRWFG